MSERRTLSRRNVLAGAAALSIGAAGVTGAAPAASGDPVFPAIAAFHAKRAAFNAVLKDQYAYEARCTKLGRSFCAPTPEMKAIEARVDAASDADGDAWWELINTAPTTREGLFAYLAMLTDRDGYGGGAHPELEELEAICAAVRYYAHREGSHVLLGS